MSQAATVRAQVEAALARRIPSALTPVPRSIRPVAATGVSAVDALLSGGLPIGAITEITGPEGSGRTSLALSFLAGALSSGRVGAWVDVSDAFDPESAAAAGVLLPRLLWVRCGAQGLSSDQPPFQKSSSLPTPASTATTPVKKGLHGGGFGMHPRNETQGLSSAIGSFLTPAAGERHAEKQRLTRQASQARSAQVRPASGKRQTPAAQPWARMEQALRVTDLLLNGGGFGAIVLDLGSIAPEHALRVPLATWFRYRATAEKAQTCMLLLTRHPCAKSSAELLLRTRAVCAREDETTVFAGMRYCVEVARRRFAHADNVIPLRKPAQRANSTDWQSQTAWVGQR